MEVKRLRASELISRAKHLLTVTFAQVDQSNVTIENAASLSQAAKAVAVLYKLHVFLHQSSDKSSDLNASIDEEITRINKKYTELLLTTAPAVNDDDVLQQDVMKTMKRLHELLGDDHGDTEVGEGTGQDDDMMQQLLRKKTNKKEKSRRNKC